MKKTVFFLVLVGLVVISQQTYAQFKDWGTKFGFRGSILFPENEFANLGFSGNDNTSFDWFKVSWLGEAFFAFELTKALELSINGGYGSYSGVAYKKDPNNSWGEYETTIIPIHLRVKVNPFQSDFWNPFFYAGGGPMNFKVNKKSSLTDGKPTKESGWVVIVPLGMGVEFALSQKVLLEFIIGGALASTYDLDGYKSRRDAKWDSYLNLGLGLTLVGETCSTDKDNDGLGKCDEEKIGTDPNNPDTDGDGLNDGEEVLQFNSNPLEIDTDLDGLSDYDEVMETKTNVLVSDSDSDELKDGEEIFKYKTNPLETDTDKDGLNDGDEINKCKTDPLKADTDGGGLNDGQEVNEYKTDPLMADTDYDGLKDGEEVNNLKTDPLKKDTDGGTVEDGTEIRRGTDPLDPTDDVVKIGVPIVLEGITFETNKSDITPESEKVLMGALKTLQTHSDIEVEISGHTDNVGSNSSNQKLSQRRADAVKAWLVAKGISAGRITAVGYGEESPRVANDTPENKRLNRRIEFKRIK